MARKPYLTKGIYYLWFLGPPSTMIPEPWEEEAFHIDALFRAELSEVCYSLQFDQLTLCLIASTIKVSLSDEG